MLKKLIEKGSILICFTRADDDVAKLEASADEDVEEEREDDDIARLEASADEDVEEEREDDKVVDIAEDVGQSFIVSATSSSESGISICEFLVPLPELESAAKSIIIKSGFFIAVLKNRAR